MITRQFTRIFQYLLMIKYRSNISRRIIWEACLFHVWLMCRLKIITIKVTLHCWKFFMKNFQQFQIDGRSTVTITTILDIDVTAFPASSACSDHRTSPWQRPQKSTTKMISTIVVMATHGRRHFHESFFTKIYRYIAEKPSWKFFMKTFQQCNVTLKQITVNAHAQV